MTRASPIAGGKWRSRRTSATATLKNAARIAKPELHCSSPISGRGCGEKLALVSQPEEQARRGGPLCADRLGRPHQNSSATVRSRSTPTRSKVKFDPLLSIARTRASGFGRRSRPRRSDLANSGPSTAYLVDTLSKTSAAIPMGTDNLLPSAHWKAQLLAACRTEPITY